MSRASTLAFRAARAKREAEALRPKPRSARRDLRVNVVALGLRQLVMLSAT